RAEAARGGDARGFFDRASTDYTAVRGQDGSGGRSLEPVLGAATASVEKAIEDSKRGADATAVFERVINEMSSVLGSRNDPGATEARGLARWALGDALTRQGKDGGEQIDKALDDLTEVFNLRPSLRIGMLMAEAWMARGEASQKAGLDPRPGFDGAARALEGVLAKLAPGNPELLMRKGRANSRSGEYERKADGDARARCKQAVDAFTEILKNDPGNAEALWERGHALFNMGWSEVKKNAGDPRVTLNLAIGDLDKALAADPKNLRAAIEKGDAVMLVGQIDFGRNNDAQETFARAVSCFEAATRIDDRNGEAWNLLGSAWILSAQSQRKAGKSMSASLEAAEGALKTALGLEYWKAHINLGVVRAYEKRWEDAEKEWAAADEKCPDQKDRLRERRDWIKDLQKRMGEEG
ncbi:MAG: hypothetical protein HUU15_19480, partial [Candidatus Brocadiae bacterium]|nr:hypothetical protein [Candidatus Brocadiia bacterium]